MVGCTAPHDLRGTVLGFLKALEHAGPAEWVVFVLLYGIITVTGLPASSMQLTSGFLFGPWWGFAVTFVLSNLFGFGSFLMARTVLRGWAQRLVARSPTLAALDATVSHRGAGMVLLLRLSPLSPYNLLSLALGTTGVRPRDYLIGSMIGAILPMAFYTGLGASVSDLAAVWTGDVQSPSWARWFGMAITLLATILVSWQVRQRLLAVEREATRRQAETGV